MLNSTMRNGMVAAMLTAAMLAMPAQCNAGRILDCLFGTSAPAQTNVRSGLCDAGGSAVRDVGMSHHDLPAGDGAVVRALRAADLQLHADGRVLSADARDDLPAVL